MFNKLKRLWLNWKYRHACPVTCMCGSEMPRGCSIGGCISEKDYLVSKHAKKPEQNKEQEPF